MPGMLLAAQPSKQPVAERSSYMDDAHAERSQRDQGVANEHRTTEPVGQSDDELGSGTFNAPWNAGEEEGNVSDSGAVTADYADIENPGTTTIDEEFAGLGGF